ncbi:MULTISPECIES: AraC family transcriptional regulator [Mannheimia]|nr:MULTISPECIES: AraC family transcriptional regulator [Mannheimia]
MNINNTNDDMDYLDNLIKLHQIEGEIQVICRFQGDWQIKNPQTEQPIGVFHIISRGQCCVKFENECHHLKVGDVVFLPYGTQHELASCPTLLSVSDSQLIPIKQEPIGPFMLCHNQQESDFEMFCGTFHYRNSSNTPLFELPKWHLSSDNASILALLSLLQKESESQLGNKSVINALASVLFTYLVRDYMNHYELKSGTLSLLQDKRLQNAVQAMLNQPEAAWSMDVLAERCAMSRSNFIRTFKEKCGISAGQFLTELRLQKAEILLQHSELSIQQIALAVGYQSEAHFSKLFKTYKNSSPSQFRKV